MDKREEQLEGAKRMIVIAQSQSTVLEAYVKLYSACTDGEAEKVREMAHSTLEALLDAERAKHKHLAEATRLIG